MNIGRYQVGQKLAEGPRGIVYKANDPERTKGPVVLKLLHERLCRDQRLEERCIELVHAVRMLPHRELLRFLGAGRLSDGRIYMVTEFVNAKSLKQHLAEHGPLPPPTALHIAQVLAEVLKAAHKKGLSHQALKPADVLVITEGKPPGELEVRLLDLGVAKLVAQPVPSQISPYLAPEQMPTGAVLTPQVDVYALGMLLFEMLSGRPRPTPDPLKSQPPIPISQLLPKLHKDVPSLIQAMLQRDPMQRPQMAEVAERLAQLEEELLIGQHIGSYQITARIAQGGMGTVFKALNDQIGRQAAIKVMRPHFAQSPEVTRRFLNEARAVNLISHPSLVEIYEFGQLPNGRPYLVMEYLTGSSLEQRRQERGGKLPEKEATELARQVALAAAAAHAKGIIHRDLKPDNVLIIQDPIAPGGERIKLLDFGIAKVAASVLADGDITQIQTQAGSMMGTPSYMAPEQFSAASQVTEKTDVYSLGVILYEALSGRRPHDKGGFLKVAEPIVPLRQLAPQVSERTALLVENMLNFLPADRPSMAQVAEQLGDNPPPLPVRQKTDENPALPLSTLSPDKGAAPQVAASGRKRRLQLAALIGGCAFLLTTSLLWMAQRRAADLGGATSKAKAREAPPGALLAPSPPAVEVHPLAGRATAKEAGLPKAEPPWAHWKQEAEEVLKESLRARDVRSRRLALVALAQSGETLRRDEIEPLLLDPSSQIQAEAARALALTGDAAAVPALSTLLERTTSGEVFVAAAQALHALKDAQGDKRLRETLLSREAAVRVRGALHLLRAGERSLGERLLREVKESRSLPRELRIEVLSVLARSGDEDARAWLGTIVKGQAGDGELRLQAARALAELGDERGRPYLVQQMEGARRRAQAARWLAGLEGDDEACALLRSVLTEGGQPGSTRLLAIEGLGACRGAGNARVLSGLLGAEGPLRQAAAGSLLRMAARQTARR